VKKRAAFKVNAGWVIYKVAGVDVRENPAKLDAMLREMSLPVKIEFNGHRVQNNAYAENGQGKVLETSGRQRGDFFTSDITQFAMKTRSDINMSPFDYELQNCCSRCVAIAR